MNSILRHSTFAVCAAIFLGVPAKAQEFGLPVDCKAAGVECRVQQYVDMDTGPKEQDPYCSTATYDGHEGTDIRVLSMRDVEKGVPVIAMGSGTVLRGRDGVVDHVMQTKEDRAAVADKECGNGMVVDFGSHEVQYCHLRQGSIVVKAGDTVVAGQKLGEIGASGMAAFPHVHITVRQNGKIMDPMTGATPSEGPACTAGTQEETLFWSATARDSLAEMATPLIDAGIAGTTPEHRKLAIDGAPPSATLADTVTVGWAWFANLQLGDQVALKLFAPDGSVFSESPGKPLDRNKADYSAFVGRKNAPTAGTWVLEIALIRGGKAVFETKKTVTVQ
ncbi:MAG: M23 family metallopeptidase [Rhizobiaceae bacterium]